MRASNQTWNMAYFCIMFHYSIRRFPNSLANTAPGQQKIKKISTKKGSSQKCNAYNTRNIKICTIIKLGLKDPSKYHI
jgi:hypothetical protein